MTSRTREEAAARAIFAFDCDEENGAGPPSWDDQKRALRDWYLGAARAAIAALSEFESEEVNDDARVAHPLLDGGSQVLGICPRCGITLQEANRRGDAIALVPERVNCAARPLMEVDPQRESTQ